MAQTCLAFVLKAVQATLKAFIKAVDTDPKQDIFPCQYVSDPTKDGNLGIQSYYGRFCSGLINQSLKKSAREYGLFIDYITFCVKCGKKCNCTWTLSLEKERADFEFEFGTVVFLALHSGYNANLNATQQRQTLIDDMTGLFHEKNHLELRVSANDQLVAKYVLLRRTHDTILKDISPGGMVCFECVFRYSENVFSFVYIKYKGKRLSYHAAPMVLIEANGFQALVIIKKNPHIAERNNMRFVAGVGYTENIAPAIALHSEYLVDTIFEFHLRFTNSSCDVFM
eukprot:778924_1